MLRFKFETALKVETTFVYLVIAGVPALLVLVPTQFGKMKAMAKAEGKTSRSPLLVVLAFATVISSLVVGLAVGYAVLVGPSFVTGLSNDMLWFTMLPALAIGILAATYVSRIIGAIMVKSFV